MHNYLKEKKKIVRTITKFGGKGIVTPEVHFYLRSSEKYRTPELASYGDNHLTIEFIDGLSCFNYIRGLKDESAIEEYLDFLLGEVLQFQDESKNLDLEFRPYGAEEKLDETIAIMRQVGHPRLRDAESTRDQVVDHFHAYATIPFRDATPKNSIVRLDGDDIDDLTVADAKQRTYHYDFSTVNELTSRYDDIISTLYHYFIEDELRDRLLKKYDVDTTSLDYVIAAYIRIGRFWSRRHYYRVHQPELFKTRYSGEDISYYDRIYDESITALLNALERSEKPKIRKKQTRRVRAKK